MVSCHLEVLSASAAETVANGTRLLDTSREVIPGQREDRSITAMRPATSRALIWINVRGHWHRLGYSASGRAERIGADTCQWPKTILDKTDRITRSAAKATARIKRGVER
jgi:hypothetical protein